MAAAWPNATSSGSCPTPRRHDAPTSKLSGRYRLTCPPDQDADVLTASPRQSFHCAHTPPRFPAAPTHTWPLTRPQNPPASPLITIVRSGRSWPNRIESGAPTRLLKAILRRRDSTQTTSQASSQVFIPISSHRQHSGTTCPRFRSRAGHCENSTGGTTTIPQRLLHLQCIPQISLGLQDMVVQTCAIFEG